LLIFLPFDPKKFGSFVLRLFWCLMKRRALLAALILICADLTETPTCFSQSSSVEDQVKAAFLYNFAKFIQWPSQAFTDRDMPFTICIHGDSVQDALDKTIEGETLNGRHVTTRRLAAGEAIRGCHIVYVSGAESRRAPEVLAAANGMPVLTVGESPDFINSGGMIRFTEGGHRVRFEINPDATERALLRVSSRLLRLADIVRPRRTALP
jgi:hypothetical protein